MCIRDRHTSVQEKTNLDLLFEKGATFEQQQAMGIHAFLNQIEQIKDCLLYTSQWFFQIV